jgi:hypothetical protein
MQNTTFQAQLADYISACAIKPFEYTVDSVYLQVFTIRTPQTFSRPVIEFSEALEAGLTQVTEIDEHGSVQDLTISNLSSSYLLIYEGTILKGGKQNRVVNATQLIPPLSKHVIPASCIEQGRWSRTSSTFSKSPHHSPQFLRKSIRQEINFCKSPKGSQSRVWEEVTKFACSSNLNNNSSDFEDIYNRSKSKSLLFPGGLQVPPAEGILLQINGELALDLVSNEPAFRRVLPQVLPGFEYPKRKGNQNLTDTPGKVLAKNILKGPCHVQPAAATGIDLRIESAIGQISALFVEGEVVSATMTAI